MNGPGLIKGKRKHVRKRDCGEGETGGESKVGEAGVGGHRIFIPIVSPREIPIPPWKQTTDRIKHVKTFMAGVGTITLSTCNMTNELTGVSGPNNCCVCCQLEQKLLDIFSSHYCEEDNLKLFAGTWKKGTLWRHLKVGMRKNSSTIFLLETVENKILYSRVHNKNIKI